MNKTALYFILLILSSNIKAQNTYSIFSNAIAFDQPYTSSNAVGFFVRGAQIETNNNLNDEWIKVIRDYQEPVYIQNFNVRNHLNANDIYQKSLAPVIDSDDYYAAPHLFVNVAGLKYREYPKGGNVAGILMNGEVVLISYYPYDENEFISLGKENGKHLGFIQRKYVGKRPELNELISDYNKAIDNKEQKKWAERILELGWNSSINENIKALEFYKNYADANESDEIKSRIKNQLIFLKGSANRDENKIEKLVRDQKIGFTLNGEIEPKKGFPKAKLEKYLGFPIKSYTDLDDCTLGDFETNIFYNAAELVGHDVNKTTYIRKMNMLNFSGFTINDQQFDGNTTTDDFLVKTAGILSNYNPKTGNYHLNIPFIEGTYIFKFINNKLWEVQLIYFC